MGKRIAGIAVVVAGMMAGLLTLATPALADTATAESQFVTMINQLRASQGLRPLAVDPRLTTVARGWSANMASSNTLAHNPSLSSQAPSDWVKLGENVGYGPDAATIHQAFVNSAHHYANMVDPQFNAVGVGVVVSGGTMWVTEDFENSPSAPQPTTVPAQSVPTSVTQGYWLVARDGGIFSFGTASFKGSTGGIPLNKPIVGMARSPLSGGYWFVAADGGIFAFNAPFYGSTGGMGLNRPIVGMAATPSGKGYWLVASDGGIFAFGDAGFYGSTGGMGLNQPIVGMAATKDGRGYWLLARDGGIFAFGDAPFYGSTGSIHLNQPIVSMAVSPTGNGYWFVAADGGIFSFGDAGFYGSAGGQSLGSPVVGISASPKGGYRLTTAAGLVIAYGPAEFDGSLAGQPINQPIVGMAAA
jgi:hypothetical protein